MSLEQWVLGVLERRGVVQRLTPEEANRLRFCRPFAEYWAGGGKPRPWPKARGSHGPILPCDWRRVA